MRNLPTAICALWSDAMISIDIVIPCAGRAADLKRLLASLHGQCAQTLGAFVATITVTDDRPSEDLEKALEAEFPGVSYVHGPARGPASNRNHGAGQGAAEWILFLDDDCYVETDLLSAYGMGMQAHAESDVLEGAIAPVGERPNGNHHAPLNLQGGYLWSCNMLVRRSTFQAVGGFDDRFPFPCMEDVDLRERLLGAGANMVFVPAALVRHPWRSVSERELSRSVISHAIYATKHPTFARQWTLLHATRLAFGRMRLYAAGGFATIAWSKYRTVAYDLIVPYLLLVVTRWPMLRRELDRRYRNHEVAA